MKSSFADRLLHETHEMTRLARVERRGLIFPLEIVVCFAVIFGVSFLGNLPLIILKALVSAEWFNSFSSGSSGKLVGITLSVLTSVLFVFYCRFVQKRSPGSMGFQRKHIAGDALRGLALGLLMISLVVLLGCLLGGFRFDGVTAQLALPALGLWLLTFLAEALREEVLCRGFLMISLSRRAPMWLAVLANSLIFGLLHLSNPGIGILPVVNLSLFGLFASLYFLRSGSIWRVAVFHAAWNIAQGNLYGLPVSGVAAQLPTLLRFSPTGSALVNGGAFGPEGGLPVCGVLLAGIAWLLFAPEKNTAAQELSA